MTVSLKGPASGNMTLHCGWAAVAVPDRIRLAYISHLGTRVAWVPGAKTAPGLEARPRFNGTASCKVVRGSKTDCT